MWPWSKRYHRLKAIFFSELEEEKSRHVVPRKRRKDWRQAEATACDSELCGRSYVKVQVAVLGSPSLIVLMVSVDVRQQWTWTSSPELGSCVKVEVPILGSPSLTHTARGLCGLEATLNLNSLHSRESSSARGSWWSSVRTISRKLESERHRNGKTQKAERASCRPIIPSSWGLGLL